MSKTYDDYNKHEILQKFHMYLFLECLISVNRDRLYMMSLLICKPTISRGNCTVVNILSPGFWRGVEAEDLCEDHELRKEIKSDSSNQSWCPIREGRKQFSSISNMWSR